jgi:hypothetical protein
MEVQIVDDGSYGEFLGASAAVVVFGIASCIPCNEYDPILEEAAKQFSSVRFGKAKLHIPGACREIKKRYTFDTFPTTHFYKNGQLVHTVEQKLDADALADCIRKYLLS